MPGDGSAAKRPLVLGIDTSCDDTGVGIARGSEVIANAVESQTALHARFGGVMPELASREHLEVIDDVVSRALAQAGVELADLDAVAATRGPGLVGALLVGLGYGKALAWGLNVPFVPVHHLEGHLAAAGTEPPFVALLASGGHTALFAVRGWDDVEELGRSRDDAAGEAFDKVARLLGLGYPGGAALARLAASGNDTAVALPFPMQGDKGLEFSFSGLKTAVALLLERDPGLEPADVAASFERVVVGSLVSVTLRALARTGLSRLVVAGGVAANTRLRREFAAAGVDVSFPPPALATDNGAMIALAGAMRLAYGRVPEHPLRADAEPYLPLASSL
ncbi:MAG: tRNA (adenosine(37)-N6)-threonylcarbamoyltransferase complex transferase subunit TsaD [Trueperaceae bacterium]|nr:tRNA (adenosine(37)-N6)-threonylcarbamoyltransferase complex transferase subunit TsaD [Trueperaceae bacterium]MCO5175038.1 tRNA (adenosine(37)-N6)-threonylcarbamoyltransferase complex transferase subunit TsaD [Trueperaceae bacterium]MCW5819574.1 tRNA (adenosine(37)-N6)-threonylcarbamoyltransferase complex transferase subunit TsaD [Trueperaceae bacterium]